MLDQQKLEEVIEIAGGELRAGGIEVVAVHNHMFFEEPRVIFLHYWGRRKSRSPRHRF
jgi:hypothetical protein